MTGCLQTGSNPNVYVLKDASVTAQEGKNTQAQAPGRMPRGQVFYTLVPEARVKAHMNLKDYVGQRVQVTGRMATATSSSPNPGLSSAAGNPSAAGENGTDFLVTSIQKTGGTCQ